MTPSIVHVLKTGGSFTNSSLFYLLTFAAVGLVAALAVRGYSLQRKKRWLTALEDESPSMFDIEKKRDEEKIEKLNFMIDEMKIENEELRKQSELSIKNHRDLEEQLLCAENLKQSYDVLYKSNVSLAKECEKLKTEREELTSRNTLPLMQIKNEIADEICPEVAKPKILFVGHKIVNKKKLKAMPVPAKNKAENIAQKKEKKRKPKRVLRKVNEK